MSVKKARARGGSGIGRRGFMSGVGATGLTAAIAVFGRTPAANAAYTRAACCNLCSGVPGMTYLDCLNCSPYYVWQCQVDSDSSCRCCECGNGSGGCAGVTGNALRCSA